MVVADTFVSTQREVTIANVMKVINWTTEMITVADVSEIKEHKENVVFMLT